MTTPKQNNQTVLRYNHTDYPSCFVTVCDDKIHMIFDSEERAKLHMIVCDGKSYGHKCTEIWEKAIVS